MKRLVLALLALATAGAAAARTWESAAFAANVERPRRIALMPARSEMVRARINEALPFVKETAALEDALRKEAAALIAARGYEMDADTLAPENLNADPELKEAVSQLEIQLGDLVRVASDDPSDIRVGRYTVGEAAQPIAARLGADALLWLESQSIVPSKGTRAMSALLGALSGGYNVPTNRTSLIAILVDLRTGEMSRVSTGLVGGPVLKEPARVGMKVVKSALDDWPQAGQARKLTKKQRRALDAGDRTPAEATADEAADEAAVVAAFEKAAEAAPEEPAAPASGEPAPEVIAQREDFAPNGPGSAATQETATEEMVAPRSAGAPAPAAAVPVSAPAAPPPPPSPVALALGRDDASAFALGWSLPAEQRPAPQAMLTFQMLDGGPALLLKNTLAMAVRVLLDHGAPVGLGPGAEQRVELPEGGGSQRLLVLGEDGRELARANCLVSPTALAKVEILRM